jgi:hypothetical protein
VRGASWIATNYTVSARENWNTSAACIAWCTLFSCIIISTYYYIAQVAPREKNVTYKPIRSTLCQH